MAGLEKILDAIKSETELNCNRIAEEAKNETSKLLEEAKINIEKEDKRFKSQTESMVELLKEKGKSAAESEKNKIILQEKQKIIQQTIDEAKEKLRSLATDKYFDIIEKLVLDNAHQNEGDMFLSSDDYDRVPDGFIDQLNSKLEKNKKGRLTMKKSSGEIKDGVMLKYGEIQENLSIDSIFADKKEMLEDKINASLFG